MQLYSHALITILNSTDHFEHIIVSNMQKNSDKKKEKENMYKNIL